MFLGVRKGISSALTGEATVLNFIHFVSGSVPASAAKHLYTLATSHLSVCCAHRFVFCTVSVLGLHSAFSSYAILVAAWLGGGTRFVCG